MAIGVASYPIISDTSLVNDKTDMANKVSMVVDSSKPMENNMNNVGEKTETKVEIAEEKDQTEKITDVDSVNEHSLSTKVDESAIVAPATTAPPRSYSMRDDFYESDYFKTKSERNVFTWLIIPPIVISLISALHLVEFFQVANIDSMAYALGVAFEAASIASIIGVVALQGIRAVTRYLLWVTIFILFGLQAIGNVYSSFAAIVPEQTPKIFDFFGFEKTIDARRTISYLMGGILPLVSFLLVKIASDYLRKSK